MQFRWNHSILQSGASQPIIFMTESTRMRAANAGTTGSRPETLRVSGTCPHASFDIPLSAVPMQFRWNHSILQSGASQPIIFMTESTSRQYQVSFLGTAANASRECGHNRLAAGNAEG
jgi:hypothetical protein